MISAESFFIDSRQIVLLYIHPLARRARLSGNNSVVECNLAKVEVAGSNPVSRSKKVHGDLPGRRFLFAQEISAAAKNLISFVDSRGSGLLYIRPVREIEQFRGNNSVVECNLAKVEVAGSNPVSRSKTNRRRADDVSSPFLFASTAPVQTAGRSMLCFERIFFRSRAF